MLPGCNILRNEKNRDVKLMLAHEPDSDSPNSGRPDQNEDSF